MHIEATTRNTRDKIFTLKLYNDFDRSVTKVELSASRGLAQMDQQNGSFPSVVEI